MQFLFFLTLIKLKMLWKIVVEPSRKQNTYNKLTNTPYNIASGYILEIKWIELPSDL